MCLAVPGRVVRWLQREAPFYRAEVEFAGIRREVAMDCVSQACPGQYVVVHAGVAISVLDEAAALELLDDLRKVHQASELADESGGTGLPR